MPLTVDAYKMIATLGGKGVFVGDGGLQCRMRLLRRVGQKIGQKWRCMLSLSYHPFLLLGDKYGCMIWHAHPNQWGGVLFTWRKRRRK